MIARARWAEGVAVAIVIALGGGVASASVDAPVDGGDLVIVDARDGDPLRFAGSAQEFTLRLPQGAACPGDSAHDQWQIQSFLIPVADDPATIEYGSQGPVGVDQWPLLDVRTRPFVSGLTAANQVAAEPGLITSIPTLSFAMFPPGTITTGTYRVGLACEYFRDTGIYWDTDIVVSDEPDDRPGQLVWRLADVDAGDAKLGGGSRSVWIVGGLAVLIVTAYAVFTWPRRRPTTTPVSPIIHPPTS